MEKDLKKFVDFSNILADEARFISLKYFKRKIRVKNKKKNGFDPVTVADIKIQKKLNRLILKSFPDHSIIGEEETHSKNSVYEWCIDPIDGTKSFIQGMPLWGTLISLSENGKIILGVADIPALDERYIGYKKKSYKIINGKKSNLKVRNNKKIGSLENSFIHISRKNVLDDVQKIKSNNYFWTSGIKCWHHAVSLGYWVNGSSDSMGESDLNDLKFFIPNNIV